MVQPRSCVGVHESEIMEGHTADVLAAAAELQNDERVASERKSESSSGGNACRCVWMNVCSESSSGGNACMRVCVCMFVY